MTRTDDQTLLEAYGSIRMQMIKEGSGYYYYISATEFDFDPDLKVAFTQAAEGIEAFQALVDKRITDLGGRPDEYEM